VHVGSKRRSGEAGRVGVSCVAFRFASATLRAENRFLELEVGYVGLEHFLVVGRKLSNETHRNGDERIDQSDAVVLSPGLTSIERGGESCAAN